MKPEDVKRYIDEKWSVRMSENREDGSYLSKISGCPMCGARDFGTSSNCMNLSLLGPLVESTFPISVIPVICRNCGLVLLVATNKIEKHD